MSLIFWSTASLYAALFAYFVRRTLRHGRVTTVFLTGACVGWAGWAADRLGMVSEDAAAYLLSAGLFFGLIAVLAMLVGGPPRDARRA